MKKINVLEVVDSIQYGGVEQVVYNYISNLNLKKYNFTIITTGKRFPDAEKKFVDLGVKIYGLPLKKHLIEYLVGLNKIIKNGKYDIVHSHINRWSFIPLFYAKIHKVKLKISHIHVNYNRTLLINIFSNLTSSLSDLNLACSYTAGKNFYNNRKFEVINNGINSSRFYFNENIRNRIRKELNIKQNDFVIGHVGRFSPEKNHIFIIKVFNEVNKINKNTKLVLIGSGSLLDKIRDEVKTFNLENNVIFLGTKDNIFDYYNIFDLFVLPSVAEGFGLAAVEAQYNGLKCLVSEGVPSDINITNTVEFLSIFDSKKWIDSICKLSKNPNSIHNKYDFTDEYNIKSIADKIDAIYHNNNY